MRWNKKIVRLWIVKVDGEEDANLVFLCPLFPGIKIGGGSITTGIGIVIGTGIVTGIVIVTGIGIVIVTGIGIVPSIRHALLDNNFLWRTIDCW